MIKGGVTGFVPITESHISIHTFVEQEHAFVDIFSCKEFDIDKAITYLVKQLEAKNVETKLFSRGREFPKGIVLAQNIVKDDRKAAAENDFERVLNE